MRQAVPLILVSLTMALALAGCGPAATSPSGQPRVTTADTASQRTLVIVARGEPPSLAAKPITAFSAALSRPNYLFNATLDYRDDRENPHPYLAEALPQLNTDTWRLLPDGRMETTYKLKPNVTWHDGAPLTADDFVFGFQVYTTPDFGVAKSPPISFMEDVTAPDPRTVVIHWKEPYPDAGVFSRGVQEDGFAPLPRHILEQPFQELDSAAFSSLPFWTTEYVGLGPYRVTGWEPGTFIEGTAFDGYVLGRPQIEQIKVQFLSDAQTAVANILSGDAHYIIDPVLAVADGLVLEQQWAANKSGEVLYSPVALRTSVFQLRPEAVETPALLDVRVRQAIAHAVDRATVVEVLTSGKGIVTDTLTSPRVPYYDTIERAIQKYAYDPRQAQQLMEQAGYPKGADGFFADANGESVRFSVASSSGPKNESEVAAYVDTMKKAGFNAYPQVVPAAQIDDPQARALLPGIQVRGGGNELRRYISEQIPRPENRWHGDNRGGWSNTEFDRLNEAAQTTLDQSERIGIFAQMEALISQQVPVIPDFFGVYTTPHVTALQGPIARQTPDAGSPFLDVHKWTWRS